MQVVINGSIDVQRHSLVKFENAQGFISSLQSIELPGFSFVMHESRSSPLVLHTTSKPCLAGT